MKRFEYLENEAIGDLAVRSYGSDLEEAFANMALGMFNAMTPVEGINRKVEREFSVSGDDLGELLYNFLEEFLYISDVENLVFSDIHVKFAQEQRGLKAICLGEQLDVRSHQIGIEIKAVTYHLMTILKSENEWVITVVFDI